MVTTNPKPRIDKQKSRKPSVTLQKVVSHGEREQKKTRNRAISTVVRMRGEKASVKAGNEPLRIGTADPIERKL